MIINQFALYAVPGLHLAENVFDDGLAGFGIVTDSVPALPSAVLSFSDISLAVCSSFRHKISLLVDNEQYRNQEGKATQKRNCYQKVINCLRQFPPLIFAYCGAIFALPEAFFFGYSGAIFGRLKVSFHRLR